MATSLKGKKVLITSGPTWVPLDNVRVISNSATGQTGILLAKKFRQQGCQVTLLLGPIRGVAHLSNKIELRRFIFFDELSILLKKELRKNYDIVIQSAAISDFTPGHFSNKKISSKCKRFKLILKPTAKMINCFRKFKPNALLVGFKFEPDFSAHKLFKESDNLMASADLDLVVANNLLNNRYRAYLIDKIVTSGPYLSKLAMANNLVRLIRRKYVRK